MLSTINQALAALTLQLGCRSEDLREAAYYGRHESTPGVCFWYQYTLYTAVDPGLDGEHPTPTGKWWYYAGTSNGWRIYQSIPCV